MVCIAQSSPPAPTQTLAQEPAETLHASTQLVIVDVVVEDKSGHPVHGLTRNNFVLSEQRKPQTIRNFEEHSATSNQKSAPPAPKLPPGVFTDYTPVAPGSTLNVLLVDALNTEQKDQDYLRQQLLDYIKREKPGTDVAIFGLANRLVMLQGFTADPEVLRTAVQHLDPKGSPLLNDPKGTGIGEQSISEAMQDLQTRIDIQVLVNLQQWEAEQAALKTHMRAQFTLDAFNSLAHYLANFPGRKNLIWFSGSFPLQIQPDTTIKNPFGVVADSNQQLRETTNLLSAAEISVYPVDARGLITAPVFDAMQAGKRVTQTQARRGDIDAYATSERNFGESQADEHITMDKMADDTGGHAFYNTNSLADAVASALDEGSDYYTLTYTPSDHKWNSAYRNIHVEVTGSSVAQGGKLAYRRGYYADDPRQQPKVKPDKPPTPDNSMATAPSDTAAAAYSRAAISRGSPTPQDIVFKVRVLPLTGKDDDTLPPDNQPDPHGRMKGPYRTFAVDYVAPPGYFSMVPQSDGRHTGAIEFGAFVYDANGNLLNISDKQISLDLPPDAYREFKSDAVRIQLQVSAPVKQESFLRLIVHDVPSNRYGVVEIPTAQVDHLPPLEAQIAPANGAASPNAEVAPLPSEKH